MDHHHEKMDKRALDALGSSNRLVVLLAQDVLELNTEIENLKKVSLTGETKDRPGTDLTRVPINIDRTVREELNILLYQPYMRGVGYSEFLRRAIKRAYKEADEQGVG